MITPEGKAARAIQVAQNTSVILYSEASFAELTDVLSRPYFLRFRSNGMIAELLTAILALGHLVDVTHTVNECRDPRDNHILELALSGQADTILTGDNDLLTLHPWRGIALLNPADFLAIP